MTMKRDLLALLAKQWVTPLVALKKCNCLSLAQRVSEWRRGGMLIGDRWVNVKGKRVKEYMLARPTRWTA